MPTRALLSDVLSRAAASSLLLRLLVIGMAAALFATGLSSTTTPADAALRGITDDLPPTTAIVVTSEDPPAANGAYTGPIEVTFDATDQGDAGIGRTEYRLNGGEWTNDGRFELLFDGSEESFEQWNQAPSGSFELMPDGTMQTVGGLGMLWHPMELGDVVLKFQWRDLLPELLASSNSGAFVRFPNPDEAVSRAAGDRHACQTGSAQTSPAWVAINCGHEIQIFDGRRATATEGQKTGSVYNFSPLDIFEAKPGVQGEWQDYELRVTGAGDWTIDIIRNGELLQTWTNTPGQTSSRSGDAPTDLRQFARGHIGLQNHGFTDHTQFRHVRVENLDPVAPLVITEPGVHELEFRSIDGHGNAEAPQTVLLTIDPAAGSDQ